jgi:poly-gamma-glutamate synthesis protein (capsule biosynthesis protein)
LGIEDIKSTWRDEGLRHGHDWNLEEYFHFWDMKFRTVNEDTDIGVEYLLEEKDEFRVLEWISEADRKADWTVVALHAHHGAAGHRNTKTTPKFIHQFARDSIDAGADAFVGTGPHFLRGLEIYENRPVFYSLGNFIFQLETVDRLPAADYDTQGIHPPYDRTTRLTDTWFYDKDGNPTDFLKRDGAWETVVPRCQLENGELTKVELYPCTLQQEQPMPQRGIPMLATSAHSQDILDDIEELSMEFGTAIDRDGNIGIVDL